MKSIFRGTGAVVAGYAAMAITIFVTFTVAYLLMGPDRAFQAGTYDVSSIWIVLTLVVGWSAATLGGKVCSLIAHTVTPAKILVAFVGILGAAQLVIALVMQPAAPAERLAGEPSVMEAMNVAVQPLWITVVNPIIGVLGTAWGSGLFKNSW
ncbi:MAG: hypothetical protein OXM02_12350 [Bacteroidota bacterium]|nr:hypothetical protein [Bacteroidota bacterium]MDE2835293.1 hypothetical protein [Bacteroidota bacterium]MDE2955670.1 hypothetical protein [Bacteroidota bacterium]